MEEKTRRELIEEMDYSGGINWQKMLPPENEKYQEVWVKKEVKPNSSHS